MRQKRDTLALFCLVFSQSVVRNIVFAIVFVYVYNMYLWMFLVTHLVSRPFFWQKEQVTGFPSLSRTFAFLVQGKLFEEELGR